MRGSVLCGSFFGSAPSALAKPASQTVLQRILGIGDPCYDCPAAPCGSGRDTEEGCAESETRRCSGNCHARACEGPCCSVPPPPPPPASPNRHPDPVLCTAKPDHPSTRTATTGPKAAETVPRARWTSPCPPRVQEKGKGGWRGYEEGDTQRLCSDSKAGTVVCSVGGGGYRQIDLHYEHGQLQRAYGHGVRF